MKSEAVRSRSSAACLMDRMTSGSMVVRNCRLSQAPPPAVPLSKAERRADAKDYGAEMCSECGNFTLVRNGTCMKCDRCGGTNGCS